MRKYLDNSGYQSSIAFVQNELYKGKIIYPAYENIFFSYFISNPKVVIVGQDPYYNGISEFGRYIPYATGIGFESNTVATPQSLSVLHKLMCRDENIRLDRNFNSNTQSNRLSYLIDQGVMLTNMLLTVEHGKPYSHSVFDYIGTKLSPNWEQVTTYIMSNLSYDNRHRPMVFILMGKAASALKDYIQPNHCCILCPHPARVNLSKYAKVFPFLWANQYLMKYNETDIRWTI